MLDGQASKGASRVGLPWGGDAVLADRALRAEGRTGGREGDTRACGMFWKASAAPARSSPDPSNALLRRWRWRRRELPPLLLAVAGVALDAEMDWGSVGTEALLPTGPPPSPPPLSAPIAAP